ncbi:HugZ family protein [Cupriavidus sp. CuC1]|uniref:HugZ family protein n=1 Tax=Cupriavidus sp. CuC1 TaxID=3373131 RepID=UPI0037D67D41
MEIPIDQVVSLLHEAAYGTLATHACALPGYPYATVVPFVTDPASAPVICVSALAEHTRNLLADARVSLSVLQPGAADVQNARRLTLVGDAARFEPNADELARYLRYEPAAEPLLALDFQFFRIRPTAIRFIGGVGRMGWIGQAAWDALPQVPPGIEAGIVQAVCLAAPGGVRVLGVDGYGIDYEIAGRRSRMCFPHGPISLDAVEKTALALTASLD